MSATALRPTPVPSAFEVRELFAGMLGREVEWDGNAKRVDPLDGATVAMYVDDLGNLAAVALMDIALTARAGSAIALMPQVGAESAVKDGLVTPAMFDNSAEILNVAASMFNKPDTPHLRLLETFAPRETLPADVNDLCLLQGSRIDGGLEIQGYGSGRISVVVAY
ncbi:hypothetical protein [Demequina mangrovi]|uniref:Uncharacterized protein n=1 Tax=Demequina mangrovi TaxID=1043493 RepID=A0A1H7A133_9MICO|nr:hypothetical protein [Demequina mangrovi]SEJ55550.1 hypothetical protein SAMN05421637_2174 [Demequina mangrovi]